MAPTISPIMSKPSTPLASCKLRFSNIVSFDSNHWTWWLFFLQIPAGSAGVGQPWMRHVVIRDIGTSPEKHAGVVMFDRGRELDRPG